MHGTSAFIPLYSACFLYSLADVLCVTGDSATCEELMKEYKACESPDYISYVSLLSRASLPMFH
jgi:uncharacterized protein YvpB